eukprot:Gb_30356 [translate_table: standard]
MMCREVRDDMYLGSKIHGKIILLKTAAQLAFSNLLQGRSFPGAKKPQLSKEGETKYETVRRSVELLLSTEKDDQNSNAKVHISEKIRKFLKLLLPAWIDGEPEPKLKRSLAFKRNESSLAFKRNEKVASLLDFLENYQPKYHAIFKSLALMDRSDNFETIDGQSYPKSQGQPLEASLSGDEQRHSSDRGSIKSKGVCSGFMDYLCRAYRFLLAKINCVHKAKDQNVKTKREMLQNAKDSESKRQGQLQVPAILTVRYNAWHYRNETEAWAGLAVEITKEMEAIMTVAQWLSACCRYGWRTQKQSICIRVILPCLFATILAILLTGILWFLLDRSNQKALSDLKYASLPLALVVTVWTVVKSVMAVVKPISSQIVDCIYLPDHTGKLGYHQKVISDINFLKGEIGRKPSRIYIIAAFLWCSITFDWSQNNVADTLLPKMTPACKDNLRIIVFVDDLDRCQETVILQVLSAINLVLAVCEINVILGMDKTLIERAIIKRFGDKNNKSDISSQDIADNYLRKIIQLPLDLPDPSDAESKSFLDMHLGVFDKTRVAEPDSDALNEERDNVPLDRKFKIGEDKKAISRSNSSIRMNPGAAAGEEGKKDLIPGVEEINEEQSPENEEVNEGGQSSTSKVDATGRDRNVVLDVDNEKKNLIMREESPGFKGSRWMLTYAGNGNSENPSTFQKKMPITSEMLMPKYSEGERVAFSYLRTLATDSRKLPREWKRLLNYHRLAWNIFSQSKEAKTLAGWQVQLIAWIFVCWQWKHQMDTVIQNWHKFDVLSNWKAQIGVGKVDRGPSLRETVESCIDELKKKSDKTSVTIEADKRASSKEDDNNKLTLEKDEREGIRKTPEQEEREREESLRKMIRQVLEEEKKRENLAKLKEQEVKKSKRKEQEEKEMQDWVKLKECLNRYNVSMDALQVFQRFRFYCVPGHLPWPFKPNNGAN